MNKRPVHQQVAIVASVFMALIYVGGGIFLIFSSLSFRFLPAGSGYRYVLAVALVAYGIYRGYRVRAHFDEL